MREHNRIADEINYWTNDQMPHLEVFELARRILIATWQNIVYNEYLPVVLGDRTMREYDLTVTPTSTYQPTVDATIKNEFATAAYRFGHTLIPGVFELFKGTTPVGSFSLAENFFESGEVYTNSV